MSNLWERFDDIASVDEVVEAKTSYMPLPEGEYQAVLEALNPDESQNGLPMLKGKFKLANGRIVFYNQVLQNLSYPEMTAKNVSKALDFVNAITGETKDFAGLTELAERVIILNDESGELLAENAKPFNIKISYGKKDTDKKYAIIEIIPDEETPF